MSGYPMKESMAEDRGADGGTVRSGRVRANARGAENKLAVIADDDEDSEIDTDDADQGSSAAAGDDDVVEIDLTARPKTPRKSMTFTPFRTSKHALQRGAELYPEKPCLDAGEPASYEDAIENYKKPRTLKTCIEIGLGADDKPCPFVSCRGHAFVDDVNNSVKFSGPIRFDDGDPVLSIDLHEVPTCSYRNFVMPHTLEEVGDLMSITRERVRQIEEKAMLKVRSLANMEDREFHQQMEPNVSGATPNWIGSVWTSEKGQRRWLCIEVSLNQIKLTPLNGSGLPMSVSTETLARRFRIVFDGDTKEAAEAIVFGMSARADRAMITSNTTMLVLPASGIPANGDEEGDESSEDKPGKD